MIDHAKPCPSLPLVRRGRLRNHATPGDFLAAPRCGARTRAGGCCRQPAMRNGRCRMHGGLSTGPRTAVGRARCAAARRTHGFYSAETTALRRAAAAHGRRLRALIAGFRARPTAGHGILPSNFSNRHAATRRTPPASTQPATLPLPSAALRLRVQPKDARPTPTAGHGVLPSFSERAADRAPISHRSAPRQGFVQRTLLGGTALALGLAVAPAATAGHGVLPSFLRGAG